MPKRHETLRPGFLESGWNGGIPMCPGKRNPSFSVGLDYLVRT